MTYTKLELNALLYEHRSTQPKINGAHYVMACLRTASTQPVGYFLHGLAGELVELLEAPDEVAFRKELGDVLWYYAMFVYKLDSEYDYDLTPVFQDSKIDPLYAYVYTGGSMRKEDASALALLKTVGRIEECYKKMLGHRKNQQVAIGREIRSLYFQIAGLAQMHGVCMSDVAYENIEKLRLRYPDGFSFEASAFRADERIKE